MRLRHVGEDVGFHGGRLFAAFLASWPQGVRRQFSDLTILMMMLRYIEHEAAVAGLVKEASEFWFAAAVHERHSGGVGRWDGAHGVPGHRDELDAVCMACGKTVHSVEFNPRHADSRQQAEAICHGLVEYHLMNDCERRP